MRRTGESLLLDDVVGELAEELSTGVIWITGGPGSGKSTALAHLAAIFSHVERLTFLDDPSPTELDKHRDETLIVAATSRPNCNGIELALQPWGQDELIEYLLAVHHDDCGSVIARLGKGAHRNWCPQLACIVLDRFAENYALCDAMDAIVVHIDTLLPDSKRREACTRFCLAVLANRLDASGAAAVKLKKLNCSSDALNLLRHEMVQVPLAASRLFGSLLRGDVGEFKSPLPYSLIELVGWQCRVNPFAMKQLRTTLAIQRANASHAMIASVLHIADPTWRPERGRKPWGFNGAIFQDAQWPGVNLFGAFLVKCDLTDSNLSHSVFDDAMLTDADLSGANLCEAQLNRANASGASFHEGRLERAKFSRAILRKTVFLHADLSHAELKMADLSLANLSETVLQKANLTQANLAGAIVDNTDFTDAILQQANLPCLDLRTACLNGTCFEKANLSEAQLEDVQILHAQLHFANLRSAHLTGSSLPSADLRSADLRGAGLAEIDWEEADLRNANLTGATFHMGSSRSGLVGSPYACEGSKTGFYTDDLEDLTFKRPEEVRKANLRGADLRGVTADGVDFYLVDLRETKLDPPLRRQAQQTGAIFGDFGK
jgi:uncharacterized protein YjbI with pentapeptide repeats